MKPFAALALVVIASSLALPSGGAAADERLPAAAKAWLEERRVVVFAGQEHYPPFEFIDERTGEYGGMAVELLRWIATEFGFTAVFRPMPFEEAQHAVLRGEADAMTGLFRSNERLLRFDFTEPAFNVPASIYARVGAEEPRSAAALRGLRVATQRGDYAIEHLALMATEVEWVYADDFGDAIGLLASGEADAMIGDEQVMDYQLQARRLGERIRKTSAPLYVGVDCMAVAKGNVLLHAILNAGIARARKTGTLEMIYQKWTGQRLETQAAMARPTPATIAATVTAIAAVAAALLAKRRGGRLVAEATAA
nr:transporter substrate-binding domain-containing protein [Spirochaetales bacterium]